MNAPLRAHDLQTQAGTLHLYALFHLNLAFSSIEEARRGEVIAKSYWPLLDLAQDFGPIGIELTGYTLEEIFARDPEWVGRLRALIARGNIELIGSGYAQLIGPLVPATVNRKNLEIGNGVYEKLLGIRPTIALVNEQAYGAGLVPLYADAGYRAILMDWENAGALHPEWPRETRFLPQRAVGADGSSIGLLWTSTVAFQKLQRLAHGDMLLEEYLNFVRAQRGDTPRAVCLYANDAEIFDFRPGRYKTEEAIAQESEWSRIRAAFASLKEEPSTKLCAPSEVLSLIEHRHAGQPLRLEAAACPVPVKKQRKYSLSRWAVTGRDDIGINAACQRIYEGLLARNADESAWKELCYLWSSDFRTHITDARWNAFCARLRNVEEHWAPSPPLFVSDAGSTDETARHIDITTPALNARLDRRRGLAIDALRLPGHKQAIIGGLPHGHFDDISLQADWYTGDCVFEAPGEHKITDLEWAHTRVRRSDNGDVVVYAAIATPRGNIEKIMRFSADSARIEFDIVFLWDEIPRGSLRLGHITLKPEAFDWDKLSFATHNGGEHVERFALKDQTVEHGQPVSFLVSCAHGFGMTEGVAEIGDDRTRVRVEVDRASAPLLGLVTHRQTGGSLFCQLVLSASELDETRKPSAYRNDPRRFRFAVEILKS